MNCDSTEQQLFELLKRGDIDAFEYVFRQHNAGVYKYFCDLGADKQLAQVLSADVFKRLWDVHGTFKNAKQLAAFVYVMARHRYLDELRLGKIALDARRGDGREKEFELICRQVLKQIEGAVKDLSPQRKRVLRLLYIERLDVPAIARQLVLSPQTVYNTKAKAIEFLRKRLSDRDLVLPDLVPVFLRSIEVQ